MKVFFQGMSRMMPFCLREQRSAGNMMIWFCDWKASLTLCAKSCPWLPNLLTPTQRGANPLRFMSRSLTR